jgi:MFS family permease
MAHRGAWRLLVALSALHVLAYVDRQLVVALAPVLEAELGLSHAQIGLVIGASFIGAYALGLPVAGVLADRLNRPRIVAAGLAAWSVATSLAATAQGFLSLAGWRALVGIGEATLPPAALSLLGDRFPPSRMGLASSVFYMGVPVGYAASLAFAAAVAPRLGWRACFLVLGGLGLAAVVPVLRIRDPRPGAVAPRGSAAVARGVGRAFTERPTLLVLLAAATLLAFTSAASQHLVTWLVRERGFAFARAGSTAAVVLGVASLGGPLIGFVTDRARRRGGPAARLYAFVAVGASSLGATVAFYRLDPASAWFLPAWLVAQCWTLGWYGPILAALYEAAPEESRATVVGSSLLTLNLLGVATGPWLTGLVADRTSLTTGLMASLAGTAGGLLLLAGTAMQASTRGGAGRRPRPDSSAC